MLSHKFQLIKVNNTQIYAVARGLSIRTGTIIIPVNIGNIVRIAQCGTPTLCPHDLHLRPQHPKQWTRHPICWRTAFSVNLLNFHLSGFLLCFL